MAVTYTTAQNVASLCRLIDPATGNRLTLGTTTDPTLLEVERWINWAEDRIDQGTGHAWRAKTVTEELHDCSPPYHGYYQRDTPICLRHRTIKTFDHATDKLEVWNGSAWVDYVDPANGKLESRTGDFWVDYAKGIIYLRSRPATYLQSVRVTYRYGEATVPMDIEQACTLLAGAQVLRGDHYKVAVPQGDGFTDGKGSVADRYEEQAMKIVSTHRSLWRV